MIPFCIKAAILHIMSEAEGERTFVFKKETFIERVKEKLLNHNKDVLVSELSNQDTGNDMIIQMEALVCHDGGLYTQSFQAELGAAATRGRTPYADRNGC